MNLLKKIFFLVFISISFIPFVNASEKIDVYLFHSEICSHCQAEIEWLNSIKDEYNLEIHLYETQFDKKNNALLVLDSLPFDEPKVVKYRNLLLDKLFRQPRHKENFSKIIFSTKPQQNMTEYTCNNWTHANIEAVQKALDSGSSFVNSSELNEVLPNDINQILRKQKEYVISKKDELWATL